MSGYTHGIMTLRINEPEAKRLASVAREYDITVNEALALILEIGTDPDFVRDVLADILSERKAQLPHRKER